MKYLLFVLSLLSFNIYACEPCGPKHSLEYYLQRDGYVIIAHVIGNEKTQGKYPEHTGGEAILKVDRVLKGDMPHTEIKLRRYFGMCDYGLPWEIAKSPSKQQYLFFLHISTSKEDSGIQYHIDTCAPIYPVQGRQIQINDKRYTIKELKALL